MKKINVLGIVAAFIVCGYIPSASVAVVSAYINCCVNGTCQRVLSSNCTQTCTNIGGVCSTGGGTTLVSCPSDCPSKTEWNEVTGYATLNGVTYEAICGNDVNTSTNKYKCEYRCGDGGYGTATGPNSGCTACPGGQCYEGNIIRRFTGSSVVGNNANITDCYLDSGCDSTGDYKYTQHCYYTD